MFDFQRFNPRTVLGSSCPVRTGSPHCIRDGDGRGYVTLTRAHDPANWHWQLLGADSPTMREVRDLMQHLACGEILCIHGGNHPNLTRLGT